MSTLVPEHLDKNKVKKQSLQHPSPVLFVPPSPELPDTKDNKHFIKVGINRQIDEHFSVFHRRIPEAYLQYINICNNLVCKKDLRVLYEGYKKEEMLALEGIKILGEKMDTEGGDMTSSEVAEKMKKKIPMMPLQTWTKNKRIYQNKIINAKKAMKGVMEDILPLHQHLLGEELHRQLTEIGKQACFTVGCKDEKGDSQDVQWGYSWPALELVQREQLFFCFY